MIESIRIESVPYFGESPEELSGLSKINFVYGTNGSGKTTISRVIADDCGFPPCTVKWESDHRLETFVYNSDFVKENFSQEKIKGIFTLGKDDIGIGKKIEEIGKEVATLDKTVSGLKTELEGENGDGGKKRELKDLESEFEETCWRQKTKHDEYFKPAFKGYRGDRSKFKKKVLEESMSVALVTLYSYAKKKLMMVETLSCSQWDCCGSSEQLPCLRPRILETTGYKLEVLNLIFLFQSGNKPRQVISAFQEFVNIHMRTCIPEFTIELINKQAGFRQFGRDKISQGQITVFEFTKFVLSPM